MNRYIMITVISTGILFVIWPAQSQEKSIYEKPPLEYEFIKAYESQTQDSPKFKYKNNLTVDDVKKATLNYGAHTLKNDSVGKSEWENVPFTFKDNKYSLQYYILISSDPRDKDKKLSDFLLETGKNLSDQSEVLKSEEWIDEKLDSSFFFEDYLGKEESEGLLKYYLMVKMISAGE